MVQEDSIPEENSNYFLCNGEINLANIQIPIVGYEIMEERARFTVLLYTFFCCLFLIMFFVFEIFRFTNLELKIKKQEIVGMFFDAILILLDCVTEYEISIPKLFNCFPENVG